MNLGRVFDPSSYPIRVHNGRDLGAGYARGWGLEFGSLYEERVRKDPVFREALHHATRRGTVVTPQKLANIFLILKYGWSALRGEVFEFGSYCGGSAAFIACTLRALNRSAKVYAFDTFEGLPQTNHERDLHSAGDFGNADLRDFQEFIRSEGLQDHLVPVAGVFDRTLPSILASTPSMALVHIDCDIYESIKYVLTTCEPYYEPGGYVVLDDPMSSSCIGAFDAMAEVLLCKQRLLPEQVYPHFVFRPKGVPAGQESHLSPSAVETAGSRAPSGADYKT